jgi:hypothetical protein
MGRKAVIFKALIALALVWVLVWAVRSAASSQRITADKVNREMIAAKFADWSEHEAVPDAAEAKHRENELRRIADLFNRLDFEERERNRENRAAESFFRKLSNQEKSLFVELTVVESMNRFMAALDAMDPEQRRKFVEQGLREVREGRTAEEMARADALGEDLLDRITEEGMRAYFEKSSADTKLDLAPLMEAMNETMQGLRNNAFGR